MDGSSTHSAAGNERIARNRHSSSVALSLGIEIILFSFLLSTFGLKVRPYAAMVEEIERATPMTPGTRKRLNSFHSGSGRLSHSHQLPCRDLVTQAVFVPGF